VSAHLFAFSYLFFIDSKESKSSDGKESATPTSDAKA
jgi:hypothetical protein